MAVIRVVKCRLPLKNSNAQDSSSKKEAILSK